MKRGRVYNNIYDEEEYKEVNQENKDTIIDFLEEYKQRKIKTSTLKQYANNLRIFSIFVKRFCDNKSFFSLTKRDVRKFSIWLNSDLDLSTARTNSILSACRSMLTYCEDSDEYEYDNNVSKKVKGLPKESVKNNDANFFVTFEDIMKIREELLKRNELQLCTLLMLSFDSGARRNEIAQVKKHGLLENNRTNVVVGKRGKTFPLVYLDDTKEVIQKYLEDRGEDNIESLWIIGKGNNKKEASYESLYDWIIKISEIFSEIDGKERNIFHHSLRHSRVECLLQGQDTRIIDESTGLPKIFSLEQVQMFLHHSDPKTTQGYAKDHTEDIINNMFDF
jgi:site-specific recombinase XerD